MKEKSFFEEVSDDVLLRLVQKELDAAKEAQKNRQPVLPLKIMPAVFLSGEFNRIPQNIWDEFGFLLLGYYRGKPGRPSTAHADKELAKTYTRLRRKGLNDAEAIILLSKERNHTDERSTRRALAKGRVLENEEWRNFSTMLESEFRKNGIEPTGNAFADLFALQKLTDKKE